MTLILLQVLDTVLVLLRYRCPISLQINTKIYLQKIFCLIERLSNTKF